MFISWTPSYAVVPTLNYEHSKTEDSVYNFAEAESIQFWTPYDASQPSKVQDWTKPDPEKGAFKTMNSIDDNYRNLDKTFHYASKERFEFEEKEYISEHASLWINL